MAAGRSREQTGQSWEDAPQTPSEISKDCTELAATWEDSGLSGIKPGSF